jgi:Zn-dependent protease with chaperone function
MLSKATAYAPPSALARAAVSLLLLLGFYALILGAAACLLVAPILVLVAAFHSHLLLLVPVCWVPAGLLVMSVFTTRRPVFAPPGLRLQKEQAPALFALIDDLAVRAGTAPPTEVFLDVVPNLAVTEAGSAFRSRRVLIVGVPLLYLLGVDELRAGIAHELGHFAGGDTRLTTFSMQTHALFASVLDAVERNPFRVGTMHYSVESGLAIAQGLGHLLVKGYSHLYMRITRPISRRQELAADALSAKLVGSRTTAAALEQIAIAAPLYQLYLDEEVRLAVKEGAMPSDVAAGFQRLRTRLLDGERGQAFINHVRTEATDVYDTHPALVDRLRSLEGGPEATEQHDTRRATVLVNDLVAFDEAFVEATRVHVIEGLIASGFQVRALRALPWARIPQEVLAPAALEAARRVAERLHPLLPNATTLGEMFTQVWQRLNTGNGVTLLLRLEPALQGLPQAEGEQVAFQIGNQLLGTLLQGALIERGAFAEDSLGEPALILRLGDERVDANEILGLLTSDLNAGRAALEKWAARLSGARAAGLAVGAPDR